jgi:YD repeat-containing protein
MKVSCDGSSIESTSKTTSSLHTGLELESIDALGVSTRKTYDRSGRVLQITYRAGTEYQIVKKYEYSSGFTRSGATLTITNSDGTVEQIEYDCLLREVQSSISGLDRYALRVIQKKYYDEYGRVSAVDVFDDIDSDTKVAVAKTRFEYDIWGNVCKEITPTGVARCVEWNKYLSTITTYLQSTEGVIVEKIIRRYNRLGLVESIRYPGFTISQEYDGSGRLIRTVNPWDKATHYTLDGVGRTIVEKFDGSPQLFVYKTFDSKSLGDQVVDIKVNNTVVGTRKYDVLGRLTSETKGAYTTKYEYFGLNIRPARITRPDTNSIIYEIHPVLGEVQKCVAGVIELDYVFEKSTGRVLSAENKADAIKVNYTYDFNGRVKSESQFGKKSSYLYSRQGQLLSSTDYFGQTETRIYDVYHRLNKVISGSSTVELEYDPFDRISKETIICTDGTLPVQHNYIYDTQSRLIEKKTLVGGSMYLMQGYEFYLDGKLKTKTLTNRSSEVTTENYFYDDYGRLKKFTATGPQSPIYLNKGPIEEQKFTFNLQGDVTEIYTKFMSRGVMDIDVATYGYTPEGLLTTIVYPYRNQDNVTLEYDANGNLKRDDRGRLCEFNVFGQLTKINDSNNIMLSEYKYTANGVQFKQIIPSRNDIDLFYGLGRLMNESQGTRCAHLLSVDGRTLNRVVKQGNKTTILCLVGDYKNSTVAEISQFQKNIFSYAPYGEKTEVGFRVPTSITTWMFETGMFFWGDGTQSEYDFNRKEFYVNVHGFDSKGLRNSPVTLNRVVTRVTHPNGTSYVFWNDGTCSASSDDSTPQVPPGTIWIDWPAGKTLLTACTNRAETVTYFFWSDGSYSAYNRLSRRFTDISPPKSPWTPDWPMHKKLFAAVMGSEFKSRLYFFWDDNTYSIYIWGSNTLGSDFYHVSNLEGWPTNSF